VVAVFLYIEARRYCFFDFWRLRAHILEVNFFGPILRWQGVRIDNGWNEILYQDYRAPHLHITHLEAIGRRLRRNYGWIFLVQVMSYVGKLLNHPVPITSIADLWTRAAICARAVRATRRPRVSRDLADRRRSDLPEPARRRRRAAAAPRERSGARTGERLTRARLQRRPWWGNVTDAAESGIGGGFGSTTRLCRSAR
jgi:hypothetical protein